MPDTKEFIRSEMKVSFTRGGADGNSLTGGWQSWNGIILCTIYIVDKTPKKLWHLGWRILACCQVHSEGIWML